jgi:FkbM family methyltransferase
MGLGLRSKILDLLGNHRSFPTMDGMLRRCRQRGDRVETVLDVGASDGRWSLQVSRHLEVPHYCLIEANPVHSAALKRLQERRTQWQYILAVAGDRDGTLYFDGSDPFGGLASPTPLPGRDCQQLPAVRLDTLVTQRHLPAPFLLKLDTHGFEVPILEGAQETLSHTQLLIVEVYNFTVAHNSLRFHELCAYLEGRGLRCLDLFEPVFRPKDGCLWQMDLVFAPSSHPCFQDRSWG